MHDQFLPEPYLMSFDAFPRDRRRTQLLWQSQNEMIRAKPLGFLPSPRRQLLSCPHLSLNFQGGRGSSKHRVEQVASAAPRDGVG